MSTEAQPNPESQHDAKLYVSRHCICCNAEIKAIHPEYMTTAWSGMWLDGIVDKISANYGSRNDGNVYILAICDTCVESKIDDGTLEYSHRYM